MRESEADDLHVLAEGGSLLASLDYHKFTEWLKIVCPNNVLRCRLNVG